MPDEYDYIDRYWEEIAAHETPVEDIIRALQEQEARHRALGNMMRLPMTEEIGARYAVAEGLLRALGVRALSIRLLLDGQNAMRQRFLPGINPDDSMHRFMNITVRAIAQEYVRLYADRIDAEVILAPMKSSLVEEEADLLEAMIRTTEDTLAAAAAQEGYWEDDASVSAACAAVALAIREEVEMILYGEDEDDAEA